MTKEEILEVARQGAAAGCTGERGRGTLLLWHFQQPCHLIMQSQRFSLPQKKIPDLMFDNLTGRLIMHSQGLSASQ